MPGEVDLEVHFDSSAAAELLDLKKVGGGPGEVGAVGSFGGEGWERRDVERPGLGVGGVEVEVVQLLEGHGVKCTDHVARRDVVSRNI